MCFTRRHPYLLLLMAICASILFSGCGASKKAGPDPRKAFTPEQHKYFLPVYGQVVPLAESRAFGPAIDALLQGEEQFGDKDRLLYLMEGGLLSLYNEDYTTCRNILSDAELLDEELYTKSITRQAATFVINDLVAPYRGEDYESVMLNLVLALAYLQEGSVEDALVEARRVDKKLEAINSQYPEDKKNIYKEDAFVRWLMGMLYEIDPTSANLNDAFISYRRAVEIYENDYQRNYGTYTPLLLKEQYLSLAAWMGGDEFRRAKSRFTGAACLPQKDKKEISTLTFIHFNGKSPIKVEKSITSPLPDGQVVKVAFPEYVGRPFTIVGHEIRAVEVNGKLVFRARSELGEPVARIAHANLENREARIMAKAIARAAIKYAGSKSIAQEAEERYGRWGGFLAKALCSTFIVLSEKADLRCWHSLPNEILVTQLYLPPGTYDLMADCLNSKGRGVEQLCLGTVTTEPGETRFFTFRTTK